ncbi:MAG: penicillin-binding protein activator [Thermodesulfobacteriota bacterium]
MMKKLFISFFAIVLILGVETSDALWSTDVAHENLAAILEDIELNGVSDSSVAELRDFVRSYPSAEVTDEALARLASIYMDRKEFKRANKYYEKLLVNFPGTSFKTEGLYGLGFCQFRQGKMSAAVSSLNSVADDFEASLTLKVKAQLLLDQISAVQSSGNMTEGGGEGYAIGAVLPLSGDFAAYGEKALKGILFAANVFGGIGAPVEVYVRDSGATGKGAKNAVRELAKNKRVLGLVGPLLSKTAIPAVSSANRKRIPIVALSQKSGIPQTGSYVFRNFLTMTQQADILASYSYGVLDHRSYAIMHPQNSYGREFTRLFKEKILALGGALVAEMEYEPGQSDFSSELTKLFELESTERLEGRRRITEYVSSVEIDAIFIPDNYDIAAQIAPYIAYFGVEDVTLLGTNLWNSKALMDLAGEHMKDAIFVDGFFSNSDRLTTLDFVGSFKHTYGYTPGLLEAESFDAAMVLMSSFDEEGATRSSVKATLAEMDGFEGATGKIAFDKDGEAKKELFILSVERRKIVELENPFVGGATALTEETSSDDGSDEEGVDEESEEEAESDRVNEFISGDDDEF